MMTNKQLRFQACVIYLLYLIVVAQSIELSNNGIVLIVFGFFSLVLYIITPSKEDES